MCDETFGGISLSIDEGNMVVDLADSLQLIRMAMMVLVGLC